MDAETNHAERDAEEQRAVVQAAAPSGVVQMREMLVVKRDWNPAGQLRASIQRTRRPGFRVQSQQAVELQGVVEVFGDDAVWVGRARAGLVGILPQR